MDYICRVLVTSGVLKATGFRLVVMQLDYIGIKQYHHHQFSQIQIQSLVDWF